MAKFYTFIVFLFILHPGFSQLTVKPAADQDNYIYVSEDLLYVKGPIHLEQNFHSPVLESSIYLREEGQLIQDFSGTSHNTGDGHLSVFQEGTSNAYDYNYWASPVGNEAAGNGNFGIRMLSSPQTRTRSIPAEITTALDGFARPLTISNRWIYIFDGKNYSGWKYIGDKTAIPAGLGFSMKGVNGTDNTHVNGRANNPGNAQRYDFRGKPNSGTIGIPVLAEELFLVGNPYPSALDLSLFLLENSGSGTIESGCYGTITRKKAITGIAYFWDSKENGDSHYLHEYYGGYGAFSPVDPCTTGIYERPVFRTYTDHPREPASELRGDHYNRRYTPIAQGFMVEGAANAVLEFKNRHRIFRKEGQYSDFKQAERNNAANKELAVIPKIRLQVVINDHYIRQLTVGYWPTATTGVDAGMDAPAYDMAPTDAGWLHNEQSFVIDVRPLNESEEIPIYLEVGSESANIQFRVLHTENYNPENVFILDTETGIYFPVINNVVELELEEGSYHDRFRFTLMENPIQETPEDESEVLNVVRDVIIFHDSRENQLQIINPASIGLSAVGLYDLTGKTIIIKNHLDNNDFIVLPTGNLANSIYLVRVLKKDGSVITKRITVKNSR